MKPSRSMPLVAALLAAAIPAPAVAGCLACSCSASTTNLNFGTYNPANSTPTQTTSTVTVGCFSILVLMVGTLDVGLSAGTSGTAAARTLANGTSRLNYNIYQENARSTVWGGLSAGGLLQTLSINGVLTYTRNITAYGSIPARQWVKPGTYSDNIVVTIIY